MSHDSPGSSVLHTPTDDQNFDDVCTYYPIERTATVLISNSLYELHHEKPCFSSFLPGSASSDFFECLRGRNKAPFPMRLGYFFPQFGEKNSQSQL